VSETLVPVTQDRRYRDCCRHVNSSNVKFGKAKNLALRELNYRRDFGQSNAVFTPLARTALEDIHRAETAVFRALAVRRVVSPKSGRMDWLENISMSV
jgi:hypothetical protein